MIWHHGLRVLAEAAVVALVVDAGAAFAGPTTHIGTLVYVGRSALLVVDHGDLATLDPRFGVIFANPTRPARAGRTGLVGAGAGAGADDDAAAVLRTGRLLAAGGSRGSGQAAPGADGPTSERADPYGGASDPSTQFADVAIALRPVTGGGNLTSPLILRP